MVNTDNKYYMLLDYWRQKAIPITKASIEEIKNAEKENSIAFPIDFKDFFQTVNGMEKFYPNEMDDEGFLFYPLKGIISAKDEFDNEKSNRLDNVYLFAEYMHKSWWYGFEILGDGVYNIGIIPDKDAFCYITSSLKEFITMYINNEDIIYNYK